MSVINENQAQMDLEVTLECRDFVLHSNVSCKTDSKSFDQQQQKVEAGKF